MLILDNIDQNKQEIIIKDLQNGDKNIILYFQ